MIVTQPEEESADAAVHSKANGELLPIDQEPCDLTGVHVLVVDDEVDVRTLVSRLLEECGAAVTMASSTAEALDRLQNNRFDVLVCDIGMPGEDGYTLIRKARALAAEQGGKVPAIALTAFARSKDRVRAMLAGYNVHLAKPVEPRELVATVASLAANARPTIANYSEPSVG
jgi:CheY-like chemotaxis protein